MSDRDRWIEAGALFAFAVALAVLAFHGGVRRGVREGAAAVRDSVMASQAQPGDSCAIEVQPELKVLPRAAKRGRKS